MVLVFLAASPSTCEGKTKIHGGCAANKKGERFECKVPNVEEILSVSVQELVSKDADCLPYDGVIPDDWTPGQGGRFSFSGNKIIVAGGCRAVFRICVNGKIIEPCHEETCL